MDSELLAAPTASTFSTAFYTGHLGNGKVPSPFCFGGTLSPLPGKMNELARHQPQAELAAARPPAVPGPAGVCAAGKPAPGHQAGKSESGFERGLTRSAYERGAKHSNRGMLLCNVEYVGLRYSPLSPVRVIVKKNEKRKRAEAVEGPSPPGRCVWGGTGDRRVCRW